MFYVYIGFSGILKAECFCFTFLDEQKMQNFKFKHQCLHLTIEVNIWNHLKYLPTSDSIHLKELFIDKQKTHFPKNLQNPNSSGRGIFRCNWAFSIFVDINIKYYKPILVAAVNIYSCEYLQWFYFKQWWVKLNFPINGNSSNRIINEF